MRLIILGKTNDDRGTQLEILTKELLESLGYKRLKMNVANDAGEVDVEGEFITPLPVEPKRTKVIAECKARKEPLNMTDWLKFLGKIYIAEGSNDDVAGCLVALSGVNGNVMGSHESLGRKNIRLVDSTTLAEYLSHSCGLAPRTELERFLAATGRRHLSVDLAYYHRQAYWVVTYDGGKYAVLEANLSYPTDIALDSIKPMIEAGLESGTFIDLQKEEAAGRARLLAQKLVITSVMLGNGSTTTERVSDILAKSGVMDQVSREDITKAIADVVESGLVVFDNVANRLTFHPDVETHIEVRGKLFVEFGRGGFITLAVGCDWWDKHVDDELMLHACKIQAELKLESGQQKTATQLMRLSPTALIYALHPDPMIVTHRQGECSVPLTDDMLALDRDQFMRSLYNGLISDFRLPNLAAYFHNRRRIEALAQNIHVTVYNRDDAVVIDDEFAHTSMIGEWHEKGSSGESLYVHISAVRDFVQRRRAASAERMAKLDDKAVVNPASPPTPPPEDDVEPTASDRNTSETLSTRTDAGRENQSHL